MIIARRAIKFYRGEFKDVLRGVLGLKSANSSQVRLFEDEFRAFLGVKYAVAVGSGREALKFILKALKLRHGDEVILPAYTLVDIPKMLKALGLKETDVILHIMEYSISYNSRNSNYSWKVVYSTENE